MASNGLGYDKRIVKYVRRDAKEYVKRTGTRAAGLFATVPDDGAMLFIGGSEQITTSACIKRRLFPPRGSGIRGRRAGWGIVKGAGEAVRLDKGEAPPAGLGKCVLGLW